MDQRADDPLCGFVLIRSRSKASAYWKRLSTAIVRII
ncbi:hypothetical protein sync_1076 [Synechococcus sp. CC9311]|nr:hypothetical protein sync_1076 [Synechococcus sp. CC9311]